MKQVTLIIILLFLSIQLLYSNGEDILISGNGFNSIVEKDNFNNIHVVWSELYNGLKYAKFDSSFKLISDIKNISGEFCNKLSINDSLLSIVSSTNFISEGSIIYLETINLNNDKEIFEKQEIILSDKALSIDGVWIDDSNFVIIWSEETIEQNYNYSTSLYAKKYNLFSKRTIEIINLSDHVKNDVIHRFARIVALPEDNKIFICWMDNYEIDNKIWARFFNLDLTPVNRSFSISDQFNGWELKASKNSNNDIVVVWINGESNEGVLTWRWIDKNGDFISESEALTSLEEKVSISGSYDIAIARNNEMVVAWESKNSKITQINAQRFLSDKTSFGNSFKISSRFNTGHQFYPSIHLNNDKIVTVWSERNNDDKVWCNTIDYNDPLLDYRNSVKSISLNKKFINSTMEDSLLISVLVKEKEGYFLFVEIINEDGNLIDEILLNNNGPGGDKIVNDTIFSNYYKPTTESEQNFTINLITSLNQHDTNYYSRENVDVFTTKGPIVFNGIKFNLNDTIPNPGDLLKFNLEIKNEGKISKIENISVKISTQDTSVLAIHKSKLFFNELRPGQIETSEKEFVIKIDPNFTGNETIKFELNIFQNEVSYWQDSLTIYVNSLTSVSEKKSIPNEFKLYQNYPNPFNPITTIEYTVSKVGNINISVYDILGNYVAELVDKKHISGNYSINFDGKNHPSGVYFYTFQTESFSETKKLLLIK